MNRYSIATLVGIAALSAGLSSGMPGKEWAASAASEIASMTAGKPTEAASPNGRSDHIIAFQQGGGAQH
jgi:hypothetical protein